MPSTEYAFYLSVPSFSRENSLLAVYFNNAVHLWDLRTGELFKKLKTHYASYLTFSQNGDLLAVSNYADAIEIWDPHEGIRIHTISTSDPTGLAFSSDGSLLAVGGKNGTIRLFETASWTLLRTMVGNNEESINHLTFKSDGSTIVSTSETSVQIWDPNTGILLNEFNSEGSYLAISPDRNLAASNGLNKTINIWDLETGKIKQTLDGNIAGPFAFSPDENLLIVGDFGGGIAVWDLNNYSLLNSIEGNYLPKTGWGITYLDKGTFGIDYSFENRNIISLVDLQNNNLFQTIIIDEPNFDFTDYLISFSPNGEIVAATNIFTEGIKGVRLFDTQSGNLLQSLEINEVTRSNFVFSPDGKFLAIGYPDGSVDLFDAYSGTLINSLKQKDSGLYDSSASISFSPDGNLVATGGSDRVIRIWNTQDGTLFRTLSDFHHDVHQISFSHDGRHLASLTNAARLWDVNDGSLFKTLYCGEDCRFDNLVFSPKENLLFTIVLHNNNPYLKIFDGQRGESIKSLEIGKREREDSLIFLTEIFVSPDGKLIRTIGFDYMERLWGIPE